MKKLSRTSRLLIAAAASTLALGALAQNTASNMSAAVSSYVELGLGQTNFSLDNGTGLFGAERRDTAYTLRGGGYSTNNLGAEIGYTDFGSINRGGGDTKAQGINLSLLGKLPLNASFNLLGKIGTTYGHTRVSSSPFSGITGGSESGFGLSYGLGAEYVFTPQWSGALQYESHKLKFAGDQTDRIGLTTLSARYRF
jgi:OmpA-OmpF porin, OOP family